MSRRPRRNHTSAFKAKVAIAAIKGDRTLVQLAEQFDKAQRKLSNGVAALPPADHLLIERDRGQFVPSRRRRMMANVRVETLAEDPGRTQPRAAYPRRCSSKYAVF